ncbi:MAG: sensor histidine kinase [Acidimicrobiales bacterium]
MAVLLAGALALVLALGLWARLRAIRHLDRIIAVSRVEPVVPPRGAHQRLEHLERVARRAVENAADATVARARLDAALGVFSQGVIVSGGDGRIVYSNPAGRVFLDARHGHALVERAVNELLAAALEGRPSERRVELAGPPRRTFDIAASRLQPSDSLAAAIAIVDDVTERRRLEEVRRDFVANISHELRTPVGAIGVLAETMVDEPDDAVVRRLADRLHHEAMRVGQIIDDLVTLSRIEAEDDPVRQPVPVAEVLALAAQRVSAAAQARGIEVKAQLPGPDVVVRGESRQLVSAVFNLLDNAVKYSDPGGVVELGAELRRRPGRGAVVEIEVEDHGIGIPSRDLERVFERFYRVDQARSRATGGTGLGLAIVRHVAANHDGEVEVRSREGEGSVFTLRIPAEAAP